MNKSTEVKNRIAKGFSKDNWRWQGWTFGKFNTYQINGQWVYIKFTFDLKTLTVTVMEDRSGKVTAEKAFTTVDEVNSVFEWAAEKAIETADGINKRVAPYMGGYYAYNNALNAER